MDKQSVSIILQMIIIIIIIITITKQQQLVAAEQQVNFAYQNTMQNDFKSHLIGTPKSVIKRLLADVKL